jgi:hypothetical protein
MEGWQRVYVSDQPHRVEIAKAALAESGIRAIELNQKDSTYITVGEIALYVQTEFASLARIILEQNQL